MTLESTVRAALDAKTKPPGSLGHLEVLALSLALQQQCARPTVDPARVIVFAGDHGVVDEGVSAWPSAVTAAMVRNIAAGGAAVSVFAREAGASLEVVDVGVRLDLPPIDGVVAARVAAGAANIRHTDAMTADALESTLAVGRAAFERARGAGCRCIGLGEMGIGNTTSATVLAVVLLGADADAMTGPGAGLDAAGIALKRRVVRDCVRRVADSRDAPRHLLQRAGGYEIAAMVGALLAAACEDVTILVDGFIATAAALVACRIEPTVRARLVFAHRSAEPGHGAMLDALRATPLLDLDMRLGEGSATMLVLPLLRAACAMLADMATLDSLALDDAGA